MKVIIEVVLELYDDDSNFEKESMVSFDFNWYCFNVNVVGFFIKLIFFKWDDVEKWFFVGEFVFVKIWFKNFFFVVVIIM